MKSKYVKLIGGIGLGIVFLTHILMLFMDLTIDMMTAHAVTNLVAGGMILYSMWNS